METINRCRSCGYFRPPSDFYHRHDMPTKRRTQCKDCMSLERLGITYREYRAMLEAQDGGCKICGATVETRGKRGRLAVDHCHSTLKIRGVLCHRCNSLLGYVDDSPELLRRAADYLDASK